MLSVTPEKKRVADGYFLARVPTQTEIANGIAAEQLVGIDSTDLSQVMFACTKNNRVKLLRQLLAYSVSPETIPEDQVLLPIECAIEQHAIAAGCCLLAWDAEVNPIRDTVTVATPLARCIQLSIEANEPHGLLLPLLKAGARLRVDETAVSPITQLGVGLLDIVAKPASPEEADVRFLLLLSRILWFNRLLDTKNYTDELRKRTMPFGVESKLQDINAAIVRARCLLEQSLADASEPLLPTPEHVFNAMINDQESIVQAETKRRMGPALLWRQRSQSVAPLPQLDTWAGRRLSLRKARSSLSGTSALSMPDSPVFTSPSRRSNVNPWFSRSLSAKLSYPSSDITLGRLADQAAMDSGDENSSVTEHLDSLAKTLDSLSTAVYQLFDTAFANESPMQTYWCQVYPDRSVVLAEITGRFSEQVEASKAHAERLAEHLQVLRSAQATHQQTSSCLSDDPVFTEITCQSQLLEQSIAHKLAEIQHEYDGLACVQMARINGDQQASFSLSELLKAHSAAKGGTGGRSPVGALAIKMLQVFKDDYKTQSVVPELSKFFNALLELNFQLQTTIQKLQELMRLAELILMATPELTPCILSKLDSYLALRCLVREEVQRDEIIAKKEAFLQLLTNVIERFDSSLLHERLPDECKPLVVALKAQRADLQPLLMVDSDDQDGYLDLPRP